MTKEDGKQYPHRIKGLSTLFKLKDDLYNFLTSVRQHLEDYGMDTIAYVLDLFDNSKVVNMIQDYPKFIMDVLEGIKLANFFKPKFDIVDCQNNDSAVKFLLNSLEHDLRVKLGEKKKSEDTFAAVFLRLMIMIAPSSSERHTLLENRIKAATPSNYSCQDIDKLCDDVKKD